MSQLIPDQEVLLEMATSELAGVVLEVLQSNAPKYQEHPGNFTNPSLFAAYDQSRINEIQLAVMEAWCFLISEGLLVPVPGCSNDNWHTLSRLGRTIDVKQDYSSFLHSRLFPKDAVHAEISSKIFSLFLSGDYETAIFKAFKLVEVAVRQACGSGFEEQYGVTLMRNAFNPATGPLSNDDEPTSEREALMHLFAGSIGRFKNPSSHRHVMITSPQEAIEMLHFASHLLRIVDDRANNV